MPIGVVAHADHGVVLVEVRGGGTAEDAPRCAAQIVVAFGQDRARLERLFREEIAEGVDDALDLGDLDVAAAATQLAAEHTGERADRAQAAGQVIGVDGRVPRWALAVGEGP